MHLKLSDNYVILSPMDRHSGKDAIYSKILLNVYLASSHTTLENKENLEH